MIGILSVTLISLLEESKLGVGKVWFWTKTACKL